MGGRAIAIRGAEAVTRRASRSTKTERRSASSSCKIPCAPESVQAVRRLRELGVGVALVSGDGSRAGSRGGKRRRHRSLLRAHVARSVKPRSCVSCKHMENGLPSQATGSTMLPRSRQPTSGLRWARERRSRSKRRARHYSRTIHGPCPTQSSSRAARCARLRRTFSGPLPTTSCSCRSPHSASCVRSSRRPRWAFRVSSSSETRCDYRAARAIGERQHDESGNDEHHTQPERRVGTSPSCNHAANVPMTGVPSDPMPASRAGNASITKTHTT